MTDFISPCQCDQPGFCPIHKRNISEIRWKQCRTEPGIFEALSNVRNGPIEIELPEPLGEGPGTELKKELEALGIPSCQACEDTARRMNELGPEGCEENMEDLVEEILPRVRDWLTKDYQWSKFVPKFIKDPGLRQIIQHHIYQAIDAYERKMP